MVAGRTGLIGLVLASLLVAGTASAPGEVPPGTVSLVLAGDAMLGRGVAPVVSADPEGLFAGLRREIRGADVAAVNVESPLTNRPHISPNPYALEADPAAAALLAQAGFDVAAIANNHAGDAGPESVLDSVAALEDAGMVVAGGGANEAEAWMPTIVEARGIRIAFIAIDVSGGGTAATAAAPGVASWDSERARVAVAAARSDADVVVVGVHGGLEYWPHSDPQLGPVAAQLAAWGVDVVWGHGPHVVQPVSVVDPDGDGRPTIVATSLGNLLFDQTTRGTDSGALLGVLVDRDGVVAFRLGNTHHEDLRVHFTGWVEPGGDAVLLDGEWWTLLRDFEPGSRVAPTAGFRYGSVVDAAAGDLTGDGTAELLVSYRHPVRDAPGELLAAPAADSDGNSAHLGVFDAEGEPIWMARHLPRPIAGVAACDGTAAFAYSQLDDIDDAVIAATAGTWSGFGFVLATELPGPAQIGCADVDHDGDLDPVVLGRAVGPYRQPSNEG